MNILFAIIGVAVLAAVIFIVKKKPDTRQGSAANSILTQTHGEKDGNGAMKDIKQTLDTVKSALKDALKDLKEILGPGELSYEEAMKYFIDHKDDNPAIEKGALLKEASGDGYVITQVFLDKDDKPVIGCKRRVKNLDSELLNLFKDKDMVIVE